MTQLTQWFRGSNPPHRSGVYQRSYNGKLRTVHYCYWDGARWWHPGHGPHEALLNYRYAIPSINQLTISWRGIAK